MTQPKLKITNDLIVLEGTMSKQYVELRHVDSCVALNERDARGRCFCYGKKVFDVYWAPEGRKIATVEARTPRAAIRKAPKPYRRYLGEMYAQIAN